MPLRAGNLGRVSKDKSGRVRSVTEQHDENRAAIGANGWLEAASYEDAVSASRFAARERPDWERLVSDVAAGLLDVVVMWESSRGSRKLSVWVDFLDLCRERKVMIHVTTHRRTYDMNIRRDRKTLVNDGVENEDDSEQISEGVRRALKDNARNGLPHGICKFGFARIHDEKTGALLGQHPVPEKASIAAEIIRRIAVGEPVSAIGYDLERRGIPNPGGGVQWYRRTIVKLATSEAYIGKRRVDGALVDGKWEPIIDEVTFWAAQHVLTSRKGTRPGKAKHLLSYIMACGQCGSPLCADLPRRHRAGRLYPKVAMYTCTDHRSHCATVPMAEADEFVTLAVQGRLASPDFLRNITSGGDERVMQARAEAARLRAELDEWATADISAHAYAIREAKLLPLIKAAEARAEELTIPLPLRDLAAPGADIAARWDAMVVAAKRNVIRLLFPGLRLLPGKGPAHERIVHEEVESRAGLSSGTSFRIVWGVSGGAVAINRSMAANRSAAHMVYLSSLIMTSSMPS
jgi:site-specific DNA recombinase